MKLTARWSKARAHGVSALNNERGDIVYRWGDGCRKADSALLHYHLAVGEPSFVEELASRGYDLTTLKFSIKKKP